jgi:hypothetical protein
LCNRQLAEEIELKLKFAVGSHGHHDEITFAILRVVRLGRQQ